MTQRRPLALQVGEDVGKRPPLSRFPPWCAAGRRQAAGPQSLRCDIDIALYRVTPVVTGTSCEERGRIAASAKIKKLMPKATKVFYT